MRKTLQLDIFTIIFYNICSIFIILDILSISKSTAIAIDNDRAISTIKQSYLLASTKNMENSQYYQSDRFSSNLLQAALLEAKKITNLEEKSSILETITSRYSKFNQQQQVKEIIDLRLETVNQITQPIVKAINMAKLAGSYEHYGYRENAEQILEQASTIINNLPKDNIVNRSFPTDISMLQSFSPEAQAKYQALHQIAFYYIVLEQENKALTIISQINHPLQSSTYKKFILDEIVRQKIARGKIEEAIDFIKDTDVNTYNILSSNNDLDNTLLSKVLELTQFTFSNQNEQPEIAFKFIDAALSITKNINIIKTKIQGLLSIAQTYSSINEKQKAIAITEQILYLINSNESKTNFQDINYQIINLFVEVDLPEKALELLEQYDNTENTYQTVSNLIKIV